MDFKDYYETLGVPPDADKKLIQQTFRQLARKHHPDVNPGNKESEEKFKTINEAYQVLSDTKQRKKYDELRTQYQQWQQDGGQKPQQDFDCANPGRLSVQEGLPVHAPMSMSEDMEDLFGNDSPYSDFFSNIFGGKPGSGRSVPLTPRRGQDIDYEVDLTLEEAFRGTERALEIDGNRIQASIPIGVRTGTRVRLTGRAEPGKNGGTAGDLYLSIKVLPNATFEREGDDLHMNASVDVFTAIAGGEIRIPTLERQLTFTIPPVLMPIRRSV